MQKIDKILIGVAFSPNLKANVFEAVRLANMFDAELVGVHVGEKTDKKITDLTALLKEADVLKKTFNIIWQEGKPVTVILQTCTQKNIDLLILGALQKENLYKYYAGSIAREITRKAPCSVLLLIKPSVKRMPCKHIVVNGLKERRTEETIRTSIFVTKKLSCKKVTIVEEITHEELQVQVNDDKSLRRANITKERIKTREDRRVKSYLKDVDCSEISIKIQSIFGKRGYSIGHYAKLKRADLLVMNAPSKLGILDRIFTHDIEYILSELPTDVLIVK